jgi:hypothetical protein
MIFTLFAIFFMQLWGLLCRTTLQKSGCVFISGPECIALHNKPILVRFQDSAGYDGRIWRVQLSIKLNMHRWSGVFRLIYQHGHRQIEKQFLQGALSNAF